MSTYNYQNFNPKDYNFGEFIGPKAGEQFIDFQATTLEGKVVSLSEYLDKPIVLETGSVTCPMYANTTKAMNILKKSTLMYIFYCSIFVKRIPERERLR